MEVIYEDNHLLVVDKPAGIPTQPTPQGKTTSLEELFKTWLREKYKKAGNAFLQPIHRLDTPVSGIVVFAKTSKALSRLQESIRQKETEKTYEAFVEGVLLREEGILIDWLLHGEGRATLGKEGEEGAKLSELHYKVISRKKERTFVEIYLKTGRYHQIRAQFASLGHPVWGDLKYGSQLPFLHEGIALRHTHFKIKHPTREEKLEFKASSLIQCNF